MWISISLDLGFSQLCSELVHLLLRHNTTSNTASRVTRLSGCQGLSADCWGTQIPYLVGWGVKKTAAVFARSGLASQAASRKAAASCFE